MKKNNLLASMAAKVLALTAAVTMSMAFTACSGDDKITPTPPETILNNSIMLDGKVMPVVSAEYEKNGTAQGAFRLYLNLTQDGKTYVMFTGNTALHIGKDINLATKESGEAHANWVVGYMDGNTDGWLFQTNGSPSATNPPFTTGTLRMDGNPLGGEVSVSLKNGKITDNKNGDGKEHTISISWKGTPTKVK